MIRFTIRDVLWLMVVVALSLALWSERKATRVERAEKESVIFWSESLQRSIEREGFTIGGADLGWVDLIPRDDRSTDNHP